MSTKASSSSPNCKVERNAPASEDGDYPSDKSDGGDSVRSDISCGSVIVLPPTSTKRLSAKRSKPEPDLHEGSDKIPVESSPPKRPKVAAASSLRKASITHRVRFGPDAADNERRQKLYEFKHASERTRRDPRTTDKSFSCDDENKPEGKLPEAAHDRADATTEDSTKANEEGPAKQGGERSNSLLMFTPPSRVPSLTFHEIVLPYYKKNVSKEEHEEANRFLARIRAKLSAEEDGLLRDALGKLCKVECGKVWLQCRKQGFIKA